MDVKGLYTNIPNNDGLQALKYFLEKEELHIPIDCILRLSELVLTLNCFEFNGEFFTQVSGTMMGSPFSVNYSCLALSYQEKLIFGRYDGEKPVMYFRYIDDVVGVSTMARNDLDEFINFVSNFSPALKYTKCIGKEVNMLDTTLTVTNCSIKSTLYSKPTDSHCYLHYDSSHPTSCKNSIPYSQFLRIRRICSDDDDFRCKVNTMYQHFVDKGYPRRVLNKARGKA